MTSFAIDGDVIARVLAAALLGAVIGIEREASEQPAGLRTHIAVSVGAALFGIISTLGFLEFMAVRADTNIQIDVTRVASQLPVGIGFIGAGMIFRQGTIVRNLTTAASLWVTSAIGLAAGVGDLGTAAVTTVVVLVGLVFLRPMRSWIRDHLTREQREVRIRLRQGESVAGVVDAVHSLDGVEIERLGIEKDDGAYVVVAELRAQSGVRLDLRLAELAQREEVETLRDA